MINIEELYIDFDEVIFPTWKPMYDEYNEKKIIIPKLDLTSYIENYDWAKLLDEIEPIPESIEMLIEFKKAAVLTKVNSMNEAQAKIAKLRNLRLKNDIILCPYELKKSEVINPRGRVLIDDTVHNLDDWHKKGGMSIYFNKNNDDKDGWGNYNTKYIKIKSLTQIKEIEF